MNPKPAQLILGCFLATAAGGVHAEVAVKNYGQELVDRTVGGCSGPLLMQIDAVPPGSKESIVAASNIGRLGRPSEPDDLSVAENGRPRLFGGRAQAYVEVPLRSAVGDTVGTLTIGWKADGKGGRKSSRAALIGKSEQLRDRLSMRILDASNLFDRYPFDPAATTKTWAQKLVDDMQASHADVKVLAVRGRSGEAQELVLLGSTFGRQGKKADEDDIKVLNSTEPATGIYSRGKRFGIDLSLHDRGGTAIGTMNVGYAYRQGDDTGAMVRKALELRYAMQKRIAAGQALDALDP